MIHHITAICSSAQESARFYTRVLDLRLVKLTVNQDDLGTYHIYFGDRTGSPGTVLTFFQWSDLPKGELGIGMVSKVAFKIPLGSMKFWEKHLITNGIRISKNVKFGRKVIAFADPDGLSLELVEEGDGGDWAKNLEEQYAINGFYGATLLVADYEDTAKLLTKHLGYVHIKSEDNIHRYFSSETIIDIEEGSKIENGNYGLGSVHHIAFRTENLETQMALRERLKKEGFSLTPSIDRFYFRSVYFREPGGILFELATDGPGFTADEDVEELGSKLVLPPKFEEQREKIEKLLPKFDFSISSPPYMRYFAKQSPFSNYSKKGNYQEYLRDIKKIYSQLKEIMKKDSTTVVEISNTFGKNHPMTPLAWDVARELSKIFYLEREIIYCFKEDKIEQNLPNHSYCLIFKNK